MLKARAAYQIVADGHSAAPPGTRRRVVSRQGKLAAGAGLLLLAAGVGQLLATQSPVDSRGPVAPASAATAAQGATRNLSGATINFAPNDPPGEWHSQARDYANSRYSPLNQITTTNVGRLRLSTATNLDGPRPSGGQAA